MARISFLLALAMGACVFHPGAADDTQKKSDDSACSLSISTRILKRHTGKDTTRRRVVYDTNKKIDSDKYDVIMHNLGLEWGRGKKKCDAKIKDMNVYYHGAVVAGGAYVIDSSEERGGDGKAAHYCLLEIFSNMVAEELGCELTEKDL